ncbi:hypothetical protein [Streptomyces sp. NPDC006527]|uniref:hypothetical protein n=1 Tax=Streptomyces sp. NPDC006527 TaxID=3364749 RepID=UPI0036B448BD
MPIPVLHRERLERALKGHEAALNGGKPLSPDRARVHRTLLELGRNEELLTLIEDFVDSPELAARLRTDGDSVLSARGIKLPEGVTMQVVHCDGDQPRPLLRFTFAVRGLRMLADWDPESGPCARVRGPHET